MMYKKDKNKNYYCKFFPLSKLIEKYLFYKKFKNFKKKLNLNIIKKLFLKFFF